MAGLPFNPMSFVTPYSAVSTANPGAALGNALAQAKQSKISEGYLANAQRQQGVNEQRYGQEEMDKARQQLDSALMSGNQDAVELSANNLRAIASRYGYSLAETRSDAQLKSGVTDRVGDQKAVPSYGTGTKADPFDADSPEFQATAADEVTDGSSDKVNAEADARIDAELQKQPNPFTGGVPGGSLPAQPGPAAPSLSIRTPGGSLPASSVAEPPGASEAPLRGYTLNGPDGKPIYSVAPKDVLTNQQKRAMGVFEGLASKTKDPQELQWLDQARAETEKLVGVMPLEEAVKTGLAHYIGQMNSRDKMAMVEANHKRVGGGGGGGAMLGKGSDAAESVQIYDDNATQQAGKIQEEDRQYGAIEDAINSGDPSVQRDAINQLLKIRSGSAVTAAEDARISRINGLMPQLSSLLGQWTGGQMSPEMVSTIRQIVTMKRAANAAKIERIYKHQADLYTVQNKRKVKDPTVVEERAKVLEEGGKPTGTTKAHLWE